MAKERELTILIIDEHPGVSRMLASGLRRIPGIRVVSETSNVMLGAELAHELEPQVIIADFRRTGPPRAETYRWIARVSPSSKLVAHTSYLKRDEERALREAGVSRCFLKGTSVKTLAEQLVEMATAAPGPRADGVHGKS